MAKIRIRYCVLCGYRPRAERAAAALREELGLDPELVRGKVGEFSVWVEERKVASRGLFLFPTERKIVDTVRAALF
jgi:selenoprotein W-related protein